MHNKTLKNVFFFPSQETTDCLWVTKWSVFLVVWIQKQQKFQKPVDQGKNFEEHSFSQNLWSCRTQCNEHVDAEEAPFLYFFCFWVEYFLEIMSQECSNLSTNLGLPASWACILVHSVSDVLQLVKTRAYAFWSNSWPLFPLRCKQIFFFSFIIILCTTYIHIWACVYVESSAIFIQMCISVSEYILYTSECWKVLRPTYMQNNDRSLR